MRILYSVLEVTRQSLT